MSKRIKKAMNEVYLTRDTGSDDVRVWPVGNGIRKFHGCVEYGSAHCGKDAKKVLENDRDYPGCIDDPDVCMILFGFYPAEGEAWCVNGRGRTKVDLAFSTSRRRDDGWD